jgi:glutamate/tyrosine decarboxylase-like PLP-dependent enzyme
MALDPSLDRAQELAREFIESLPERHVGGGDAEALRRQLTDKGEDPVRVIEELATDADPGIAATAGPRYFGFVTGGSLPVTTAADWLVSAWDQMAGLHVSSPAVAVAEEVAAGWVLDILGLPDGSGVGFATGAQMANFTCLAAARGALLDRAGWDVGEKGLYGAPEIDVFVGDEVHVTVLAALRYLGLGQGRVTRVATNSNGAMDPAALATALDGGKGPVLVCAQAGNVNTGACDPLGAIADVAAARDAWVHVDGAFGLWAAASPGTEYLVTGRDRCHSWALDAHKWLNVPYDSAIAIVGDVEAQQRAMSMTAAYLMQSDVREPHHFVPEASRRARVIPVYAALRFLGRNGVAELVERCCRHARTMADTLEEGGMEILNDVMLNQVLAASDPEHLKRIQDDGTLWLGGTEWRERFALRVSFSNWSTSDADVRRSAETILSLR